MTNSQKISVVQIIRKQIELRDEKLQQQAEQLTELDACKERITELEVVNKNYVTLIFVLLAALFIMGMNVVTQQDAPECPVGYPDTCIRD